MSGILKYGIYIKNNVILSDRIYKKNISNSEMEIKQAIILKTQVVKECNMTKLNSLREMKID